VELDVDDAVLVALHPGVGSVPPSEMDVGEKFGAEWTGKIARRPVKSTESESRSIWSSMYVL
jgi:hypothetical protein